MFINLTNHPVAKWSQEQIEAAKNLGGKLVCMTKYMPVVPPEASEYEVLVLVNDLINCIRKEIDTDIVNIICLVQGEYTLTYCLVYQLQQEEDWCQCVVATTNRDVVEVLQLDGSIKKESVFRFVKFREYPKFNW